MYWLSANTPVALDVTVEWQGFAGKLLHHAAFKHAESFTEPEARTGHVLQVAGLCITVYLGGSRWMRG